MISQLPPNANPSAIRHALFFPDIGIIIGSTAHFSPSLPLRAQLSTVAWDGRDSINVNARSIAYSKVNGARFEEGDVVTVDLNLDGPQTSLGFKKNGIDFGTAVRGFPPKVYLALSGKAPAQIRWLALAQMQADY